MTHSARWISSARWSSFSVPQNGFNVQNAANKNSEQSDGPNHHAFGTFVTHPPTAGFAPKASGDRSSQTFGKNMTILETLVVLLQLLAFVGIGFFLIRSLIIFRKLNDKGRLEFPPITWLPMFEFPYAILAPMIHWRKNKTGRICLLGIAFCTLIVILTAIIQTYVFSK